jgi:two-component system chemotaxis response regulator CheB
MGIKRLKQGQDESVVLQLKKGEGLLTFVSSDRLIECLYFQGQDQCSFEKLKTIAPLSGLKYVGDEGLYRSILKEGLEWPSFERTVFTQHPIEVLFYQDSGKVRISKNRDTPKKKVLIIDDSPSIQKILRRIIESSDKLEVMATADRPSKAQEVIEGGLIPDIITLDIHMPEMNGVEFLKSYLSSKNIPTVMVSSVSLKEGGLVLEALSSGALSYIQKPSMESLSEVSSDIINQLELLTEGQSPVVRLGPSNKSKEKFHHTSGLIAFGSSTGGTQALELILKSFPERIPPIVITQHIPAVFSKAFADRLNGLCPFFVKEAEDSEVLRADTVFIAPGGKQMGLKKVGAKILLEISDAPPVNNFKPSVDFLFDSITTIENLAVLGVILTGMGKDGAQGLLNLKNQGALTIAQDEQSSVVFGMPKKAIELGAAQKIVSLQDMSKEIVAEFNKIKLTARKVS